jgi:hypothetical protein
MGKGMAENEQQRDRAADDALSGDPEAWEPWESALVLVTVTVGAGGLVVLGWLVDRFILS